MRGTEGAGAVTQSRWDMLTARIPRENGGSKVYGARPIFPPWGGQEGMNQHGELAVVKQAQRAEQLTVDRDLLFLHTSDLAWVIE